MKKTSVYIRFLAWLVDFSVILLLSVLIEDIIYYTVGLDLIYIILLLSVLYKLLFYNKSNPSIGKKICNIDLVDQSENGVGLRTYFYRELLLKLLTGIGLPAFLLVVAGFNDIIFIIIIILFLNLLAQIFSFLFFGTAWWDKICKTIVRKKQPGFGFFKSLIKLLILWIFLYSGIVITDQVRFGSGEKILGLTYSYKEEGKVKSNELYYLDFLDKPHQSPVDYVLSLFDKYDIVILCERMHNEYTQWNLFYEIISDERFAAKVGNFFTEYGSIDKQYLLDSVLCVNFSINEALEKHVSVTMRYLNSLHLLSENRNFFDFMIKMNEYNHQLPDSLKINGFFTNQMSWDFIRNQMDYQKIYDQNYDSVLAWNFINQYHIISKNKKRNKCLIITNTRHAFNDCKCTSCREHSCSQASIIMEEYPDKTANVFINSYILKYPVMLFFPVNKGVWDRAFSGSGNKPIGFDFSGSPFGKDKFDYLAPLGGKSSCCYEDVFTGFVFYNPVSEFKVCKNYPFILDGFEEELVRRSSIVYGDTIQVRQMITQMRNTPDINYSENDNKIFKIYLNLVNFSDKLFLWFVLFLTVLLLIPVIIKQTVFVIRNKSD